MCELASAGPGCGEWLALENAEGLFKLGFHQRKQILEQFTYC
jgi:hypothetical protein